MFIHIITKLKVFIQQIYHIAQLLEALLSKKINFTFILAKKY